MDAAYWLCAAASLLGTWWNIQRRRACFVLWLFTNGLWAHASFTHGLPAKGWLHVAYGVLSVVGLCRWRDAAPDSCARCSAPSD
jgi:hypothetical protein